MISAPTVDYIIHTNASNQRTKDIWIICMDKGTHVSAAYIPGKQNILAIFG